MFGILEKASANYSKLVYDFEFNSIDGNKINKFLINDLKKDLINIKKMKKYNSLNFPLKFKELKQLLNKKTLKRINCVILPMEALLKAFKIN